MALPTVPVEPSTRRGDSRSPDQRVPGGNTPTSRAGDTTALPVIPQAPSAGWASDVGGDTLEYPQPWDREGPDWPFPVIEYGRTLDGQAPAPIVPDLLGAAPTTDDHAAQAAADAAVLSVREATTRGIGIAAVVLMVGNLLSRVLGLVREQVTATLFGAGDQIAAFTIADNVHTMLFDLVISGMMQAALIPVLSEYAGIERRTELRRITGALLTMAIIFVGGIVAFTELFAPQAVTLMTALGGGKDERGPEVFALTVELTRIILPAVFLLAISTIMMSTLYALQRFTRPSLSLSLRNVAIITSALTLGRQSGDVRSLAIGIVLGALLLIIVQAPGLRDVRPIFNFNFRHPAIRRIGVLYVPIFIGLFANTLALVIDRNLAWGTGEYALGAMRYATTLNQMVLGLVAAAISLAALPALSRLFAAGDEEGYWETLASGIRMTMVLVVPATFGIAVLGWPMVRLLFEHGETGHREAVMIFTALLVYLPGTLFAALDQVLIFAYFARQNTRTPQIVGVTAVGIYFIFALTLVRPLGMAGLVAANSAQFIFHTIVMIVLIRRLVPPSMRQRYEPQIHRTLRHATLVSVGMALIAGTMAYLLTQGLPDTSGSLRHLLREMIVLCLPAGVGVILYAGGMLVAGNPEVRQIQRKVFSLARR